MPSLEAFLEERAGTDHALGNLLRNPDASKGLVHTPREIAQQTWLWRETAVRMQEHAAGLRDFTAACGLFDEGRRPTVALAGAGTSDYVGVSLSDLFRRRFMTASYSWPTTRITAFPDAFLQSEENYLIVHFARSGDSPESRAVLELCLRHFSESTRHIVITCNTDGKLAELARANPGSVYLVVLHEAANDRGLAMTSSFTNMVAAGQALAHLDDMDAFADLIDRTADAGDYLIDTFADVIHDLAAPEIERAFYLGNVDQLGAAVESALKVQEMTAGSVMASGQDTLALRHGPVAAVDNSSAVCFFLSANDYARQYELDVIEQFCPAFQQMGAATIVVGDRPCGLGACLTGMISYDPDDRWSIPVFHQVNLSVLYGQLFGLFACVRRGLNADNPAAEKALYSRTVQGVRLYDYTPTLVQA